jgi:hypothetical protein
MTFLCWEWAPKKFVDFYPVNVDNQRVHLPGEHPVTRGEDLWPKTGDGVGDVAHFLCLK